MIRFEDQHGAVVIAPAAGLRLPENEGGHRAAELIPELSGLRRGKRIRPYRRHAEP